MNKNIKSVGQYVAYTSYLQKIEVKIKKDLTIILFAVSLGATASPCYDIYTPVVDVAEALVNTQTDLSLSLRDNTSDISAKLHTSLMAHRGNLLSTKQMESFHQVEAQIQCLNVTEVLVRYNDTKHHLSYDMLLDNQLILHLTQYFDQPMDQLVYSIERDDRFIKAGHAPIEGFGGFILKVVDEVAIA